MKKVFYVSFIYVYFWNHEMDNPIYMYDKLITYLRIIGVVQQFTRFFKNVFNVIFEF